MKKGQRAKSPKPTPKEASWLAENWENYVLPTRIENSRSPLRRIAPTSPPAPKPASGARSAAVPMQSPEPSSSSPVLLNIGRSFLPSRIYSRVPFPFRFGRESEASYCFPCCDCDGDGRGDAGGKKYATTVETLTQREPDSMLAAMFSGRHTLPHEPTTVRFRQ